MRRSLVRFRVVAITFGSRMGTPRTLQRPGGHCSVTDGSFAVPEEGEDSSYRVVVVGPKGPAVRASEVPRIRMAEIRRKYGQALGHAGHMLRPSPPQRKTSPVLPGCVQGVVGAVWRQLLATWAGYALRCHPQPPHEVSVSRLHSRLHILHDTVAAQGNTDTCRVRTARLQCGP